MDENGKNVIKLLDYMGNDIFPDWNIDEVLTINGMENRYIVNIRIVNHFGHVIDFEFKNREPRSFLIDGEARVLHSTYGILYPSEHNGAIIERRARNHNEYHRAISRTLNKTAFHQHIEEIDDRGHFMFMDNASWPTHFRTPTCGFVELKNDSWKTLVKELEWQKARYTFSYLTRKKEMERDDCLSIDHQLRLYEQTT